MRTSQPSSAFCMYYFFIGDLNARQWQYERLTFLPHLYYFFIGDLNARRGQFEFRYSQILYRFMMIFFCEVGSSWDLRTQTHWPSALSFSFKFIGAFQQSALSYRGPRYLSASLLSSSCAAYTAGVYARLGALPIFCGVSCPICLWTERTYRLILPEIFGWSHIFTGPPFRLFYDDLKARLRQFELRYILISFSN